ncbi:FkbM family methyltransferase [Gelidibacter gilvus]|uniref:FkbM family methyltransferase n=1 Tax=Gelidibacter gilvus TaxID=59602 RepID=A0A4Q0XCG8_9FLAO|nr:FkbM family methyltransferase [Gelidibacter gilvus]RXJ45397.1 FkbM family methyltransferase [Gelidibacter gilvus]
MVNIYRFYLAICLSRFLKNKSLRGKKYLTKLITIIKPKVKCGMIVKTLYGFKLEINPNYDKGIETQIYKTGIYEEGTLWCFQKILKKNDVVFDIGANIGLTSIYASKLVGRNGTVHVFEPLTSTFEILKRNIKVNRLTNVKTYNIALSNHEGVGLIYKNLHINRGAASLKKSINEIGENVIISTLDRFVSTNAIELINFMKIDVEGSEYDVLEGGLNMLKSKFKPIICLEYSEDVESLNKIKFLYNLLNVQLGYDVFKSIKGKGHVSQLIKINDKSELPKHDNIYCFQSYHYSAISKDLFFGLNLNS